jgi:large subunit ribosomal protein L25
MNTIKATKRDIQQKSTGKDLKKNGFALATIYGRGNEHSLAVDLKAFNKVFSRAGKQEIITLEIEGEGSKEVLVKDYQLDGIKRTIRHIDFYEIDRTKKIKTVVPIHLAGTPESVRLALGVLEQIEHQLSIRAFPGSIPKEAIIDVSALELGHSLHVSDIVLAEGVEAMGDHAKAVVTITAVEVEADAKEETA